MASQAGTSNDQTESLPHSYRTGISDESTPLLSRDDGQQYDTTDNTQPAEGVRSSAASTLRRSIESYIPKKRPLLKRWPSILALSLLCLLIIVILIAAFVTPEVVEEYGKEAATFNITSVSINSFTKEGCNARIQGDFSMDASRVKKKSVRDIGRFATHIAKKVETKWTKVDVTLPEYGGTVLGAAYIPPLVINIQNQKVTKIDIVAELEPGSKEDIRRLAKDWLEDRIGELRVKAIADVNLHSGIFSFGSQTLSRSILFQGDDIPSLPQYNITHLTVHEKPLPHNEKGLEAEATLKVKNPYPVGLTIPPLGFSIAARNCKESQPKLPIADAVTSPIHVESNKDIQVKVAGFVNKLPPALIKVCPDSGLSPLDFMLAAYMNGTNTTIYVQGSDIPAHKTPKWITDLISGLTLPINVEGSKMDHLIKNFTMSDVHFNMPDFFAKPGSPEAQPRISANLKAIVGVPDEINFPIDVPRVKGLADIYYKGDKFGFLDLHEWRDATSRPVERPNSTHSDLEVESKIDQVPIEITDNDVFVKVVTELAMGDDVVHLDVKASVDVELATALGVFKVRNIYAEGDVPVEPIGGSGGLETFSPKIGNLIISKTTTNSVVLDALMNFTNPTVYSATVPYVDLKISINDTILGHATSEHVVVKKGNNTNIPIRAVWNPSDESGEDGVKVWREFISQYISGYNTTLTLFTHENSIPSQPALGEALSSMKVDIPTPQIGSPHDPDDDDDDDEGGEDAPNFIKKATMHIFTSTASFTLVSPLKDTTMYITYLNATAHHHNETVGSILYEGSIEVPPGASETPSLPVDWCLGCVGFEDIKNAVGGSLKLGTQAIVGVHVGKFKQNVWFEGHGIGVKVRV